MKKVMIAATLLLALTAHAEFKDGNKLLSQMQKEYAGNDWFNAIGYVTGVVDAHNGNLFCAPATSTAAQLFDMTKQYSPYSGFSTFWCVLGSFEYGSGLFEYGSGLF